MRGFNYAGSSPEGHVATLQIKRSWLPAGRDSTSSGEGPLAKRKHRIGYSSAWKGSFPWHVPVYADTDRSSRERRVIGLLCSLCQRHQARPRNGSGIWIDVPCTSLRTDILQRHKRSEMHSKSQRRECLRLASERNGGIRQAFSARVVVNRKALIGSLQILYWLVREEIAHTTTFVSLRDLAIHLDCDYLRDLNLGGNAHYSSEQCISELLQSLSAVIEEHILSDLTSSEFFALMTDESTDTSVLKQLALMVRYATGEGIKTSYLNIRDLVNGRAETIESALLQVLRDKSIDVTKLRGFSSDGASVMTGRLTGVATRLKQHTPRMLAVHCANHRLALAAAHAADNIPYLQRYKSILQTLYFYQNSAVGMASLHSIQEVLNDPHIKCKLAEYVRWLSHDHAIKALIRTFPSILVSLDREASENNEATAHGLLNFMKCYKFIATTYLLSDVLPHLSRLSPIFQKENIDLTLIQPCLQTTIDTIKEYKDNAGPNQRKLDSILVTELKDFQITSSDATKEQFKSNIQSKYIEALIIGLENRFPDITDLSSFSIFDPTKLPSSQEEFTVYGIDKLEHIVATYGNGPNADVDGGECESEWECLKNLMRTSYSHFTMRQMVRLLCTDPSLRDMFPQLSKVASISALIPVSTAECERAFSAMNRIKTDLRNRLSTSTLDYLMRISIEGPSVQEFNLERAANIWGGMRNRRLSVGVSPSLSSSSSSTSLSSSS